MKNRSLAVLLILIGVTVALYVASPFLLPSKDDTVNSEQTELLQTLFEEYTEAKESLDTNAMQAIELRIQNEFAYFRAPKNIDPEVKKFLLLARRYEL